MLPTSDHHGNAAYGAARSFVWERLPIGSTMASVGHRPLFLGDAAKDTPHDAKTGYRISLPGTADNVGWDYIRTVFNMGRKVIGSPSNGAMDWADVDFG